MSFLSDIVGGIFGNKAANKAADSMVNATKLANQTMLDMFQKSNQITAPGQQAGWNALAMQGSLLGNPNMVPQGAVSAAMAAQGMPGAQSAWSGYLQANPDVAQAAVAALRTPHMRNLGITTPEQFAEYHFNTFGQAEGRQLPTATQGGQGGMNTGVGVGSSVDDAYGTFLGSGFNRAMTDFTNNDLDQLKGTFAAGGKSLSGSAVGAMGDRLARNRYTAFGDYYNALSGISGTGAQLSSQAGQNAISTGNNVAANQQNIGNIRGSSYLAQGQNNANMVNSGVNALASWFGGMK
jgi:hypothetical protein